MFKRIKEKSRSDSDFDSRITLFSKYLQKFLKLLSHTPTTNNANGIGKWTAKTDKVVDLIHFISDAEITMFWMLLTSQRSLITRQKMLFLAGEKQNWRWISRQENQLREGYFGLWINNLFCWISYAYWPESYILRLLCPSFMSKKQMKQMM